MALILSRLIALILVLHSELYVLKFPSWDCPTRPRCRGKIQSVCYHPSWTLQRLESQCPRREVSASGVTCVLFCFDTCYGRQEEQEVKVSAESMLHPGYEEDLHLNTLWPEVCVCTHSARALCDAAYVIHYETL